jgi:DNA polymerase-3 subunit epsilon
MMSTALRWFGWARNDCAGVPPDTALRSLRYVVLDTELTSLDPRSNRVVSLGAVAMDGDKIRLGEQLYKVVNPGIAMPAETILIHRLRPADIVDGEAPRVAIDELMKFAVNAVLVGHFVSIDVQALRKEMADSDRIFENRVIDTARVQRWLDRRRKQYQEDRGHDPEERCDLASLKARYRLQGGTAHHALEDAFVTAQLWQRLMYGLENAGIRTLGKALKIGAPS